jgi:uncharacterized protein YndB with AHSA1/START domain
MKAYEASVRITAPAESIWSTLVDGAQWPSWDSGVEQVTGSIVAGNKVTIKSAAAPGRAFPVKVTEYQAPKRLVFSGGMPLGLFTGVRTYTLSADGDATLVTVREEYTGPLLGMIWRSMPDLQPSFDQFVRGLKIKVEGTDTSA